MSNNDRPRVTMNQVPHCDKATFLVRSQKNSKGMTIKVKCVNIYKLVKTYIYIHLLVARDYALYAIIGA